MRDAASRIRSTRSRDLAWAGRRRSCGELEAAFEAELEAEPEAEFEAVVDEAVTAAMPGL
jgi:hypothetical protein